MARGSTKQRRGAPAQMTMDMGSTAAAPVAAEACAVGSAAVRPKLTPRYGAAEAVLAPPVQAVSPEPTALAPMQAVPAADRTAPPSLAFGAWLLQQKLKAGLLGQLATAADADRGFPRQGDPEDVRKRMGAMGADGEMWDALDDAELDWLAL